MTKNPQDQKKPDAIRFETVTPIQIREKDGALSFNIPGETIQYEKSDAIKMAMLAHKFNQIAKQMHNVQAVVFANNQLLQRILNEREGDHGNQKINNAIETADGR